MDHKYKAVAFIRVATNAQMEVLSHSQTRQELTIFELADIFPLEIVDWFKQIGGKASASPATKLYQVYLYCKDHPEVKYLLVSQPDRICRNLPTFNYWKDKFKKIGVKIITPLTESLDEESISEVLTTELSLVLSSYQRKLRLSVIKRGPGKTKEQSDKQDICPF